MTANLRPLLLAAGLLQACVSAPPDVEQQADLGRVAVVAGATQPQLDFRGFPRGRVHGAAIGAGQMFLQCASTPLGGCGGDAICGTALAVWAGVCAVGTAAGAVIGAIDAPPARIERQSETTLAAAVDVPAIHEALRAQVETAFATRGAPTAEARSADTLLEVSLSKARFDPNLELHMHATVRLLRRIDGKELSITEYVYTGPRYTIEEWAENGAARLLAGLKTGYQSLGAHIHDVVFLLYPFPDREWRAGSVLVTAYGLAPLDPVPVTPRLTMPQVRELQPTLRWQSYPRPEDVAAAPEAMARVRNVRYDLVIAASRDYAPAETVYRREALPQPVHALETPLAAHSEYYWSVRARFELDGRERVTAWGSTYYDARETWTAPSRYSYRFLTPP